MCRKKLLLSLIMLVLAISTVEPAFGISSWVNIANPRISYLDDNLYRFRVDVTWGGDQYTDPASGMIVDPILDRLWITNILGSPVAWTGNHSGAFGSSYAGDWYGGIESSSYLGEFGLHGPEFGWDFIPDAPMQSSYNLNYTAFTAWLDYDHDVNKRIEGGNESYAGNIEVMVIPEPATMILFALGIVGIATIKRRQ